MNFDTLETIKIEVAVSEEGTLYGSVGIAEIAAAVTTAGVELEKKEVSLPGAIRTVGEYDINIQLPSDVVATVKIEVVAVEATE